MMDGDFDTDPDGRLYAPRTRDSLRPALPSDQLLGYEALVAIRRAAFVFDHHTRAPALMLPPPCPSGPPPLRAGRDDPAMRVLMRLRREPGGLPVAELLADPDEEVQGLLDMLDREGMLVRSGSSVRLSDLGAERVNDAIRRMSDQLATLVEGIPAEQLAIVRHVCLQLILNHTRPPGSSG